MTRRGEVSPELEAVIGRHVRVHLEAAVSNLEKAPEPLRERATVYRGSLLYGALENAIAAGKEAERYARSWKLRTGKQLELGGAGE